MQLLRKPLGLRNELETKACPILSGHAPVTDRLERLIGGHPLKSRAMEQKPESFSSRWIAPEPVLVERFDIISHEAEFVASQVIQVIPRIDSGVV